MNIVTFLGIEMPEDLKEFILRYETPALTVAVLGEIVKDPNRAAEVYYRLSNRETIALAKECAGKGIDEERLSSFINEKVTQVIVKQENDKVECSHCHNKCVKDLSYYAEGEYTCMSCYSKEFLEDVYNELL